jgi:NADH dehydrogenase (ubiquinone) 1 beta subcomplex subunit 7
MGGARREMVATQKDMQDAKIDLAHRDFCAHLLIPLNECRKAEYYIPWKCGHERHAYEKCQYKECVAGAAPDRRSVDRASERINP